MLIKKEHIFEIKLTKDELINRLEKETESWKKDNSTKKFVGKVDQNGFSVTPILKFKKNGYLPRFSGEFIQLNGKMKIYSELNRPQKILIYGIIFLVIPLYVVAITINWLPIQETEKIIFGVLILINFIVLKIAYNVNLNRGLDFLKEIWKK